MFTKLTTVFALPAGLLSAGLAGAAHAQAESWTPASRDTAVAACIDLNGYKPATLVDAAVDGLGDWIVWVRDKDQDLWLCNANSDGEVYANVLLEGDLLAGDGSSMVEIGDDRRPGPAERAERLCAAVGNYMEDLEIIATVGDGLGDYLVWLKNGSDAYWMCNASADEKLYAFETVQYPITGEAASDDAACCEPYEDRRI